MSTQSEPPRLSKMDSITHPVASPVSNLNPSHQPKSTSYTKSSSQSDPYFTHWVVNIQKGTNLIRIIYMCVFLLGLLYIFFPFGLICSCACSIELNSVLFYKPTSAVLLRRKLFSFRPKTKLYLTCDFHFSLWHKDFLPFTLSFLDFPSSFWISIVR